MAIRFRCTCGKVLVTADEHAGKRTKCPACGKPVAVPAQSAPGEQPLGVQGQAQPQRSSEEESLRLQDEPGPETPSPSVDQMLGAVGWHAGPPARSRARRSSALTGRLGPIAVKAGVIAVLAIAALVLWRSGIGRSVRQKAAEHIAPEEAKGDGEAKPPNLKPGKFRKARSLRSPGGTISPKSPEDTFVLVPIDVPTSFLVPSDSEYQRIVEHSKRFREKSATGSKKPDQPEPKRPDRNCIVSVDSRRFTLILANGRRFPAGRFRWRSSQAGGWQDDYFFSNGWRVGKEPVDVEGTELVEVLWVLHRTECTPPFKVQFDSKPPVLVPGK